MKKNSFVNSSIQLAFTIMLLFVINGLKAQSAINIHSNEHLVYYLYGEPALDACNDSCRQLVAEQYGFTVKRKANGVVRRGQVKHWNKHNRKVDEALNAKHGMGWRDRYEDEVRVCCGK